MEGQRVNLLIVGAAGEVCRAVARRMASRATIVLADADGDTARAFAAELRDAGHLAHGYSVDISRSEAVAAMFVELGRDIGPIHSLFYGTGGYAAKPIEAITEDDWQIMIGTQVKGAYLCAKALLPQMRERCGGSIVTMASGHAVSGFADNVAYAAAQTALYALTKSLARAFASDRIRVNAIGPSAIDDEILCGEKSPNEWERIKSDRAQETPMRRLGRAEEVAAAVDFLLGERSSYLTGQIIHINGGALMW